VDSIDGRSAFVTGGASGIGLAIAESLLAAGARVVLADVHGPAAQTEARRLTADGGEGRGPRVLAIELDVTDLDGWTDAKRVAEDALGPIDILVNNAGIGPDLRELTDMAPATFDRLVAIKVSGTFNGIHTFAPGLRARGQGHIVNTASMAGLMASARLGAYTTAMFGVVGLSEVLRAELGPHGVGVSVLCPGLVRTNLRDNTPEEHRAPTAPPRPGEGIDPAIVGDLVVKAIRDDEPYVVTHGEYLPHVAARAARIQRAFEAAPVQSAALPTPVAAVDPE
jgi:NAD(P)-dependent dehydrogenase (short-subunit alcohol dehydrogenase family)